MALYYEGSTLILMAEKQSGSLKTRIFDSKATWKSSVPQLYALVSETSKWSPILKEVVERSSLLMHERKLSPELALLLVHDLLLTRKGIAAPASHSLRASTERHKARLQAEFTKARLRRGCASIEALKAQVESSATKLGEDEKIAARWAHPRWVRVNSLKTTLDDQLQTTFTEYRRTNTLREVLETRLSIATTRALYIDPHISNLIALPPGTDLSNTSAYRQGQIILQDKASCFPAVLLDPRAADGEILDACAAPGNKTTHLAALLQSNAAKTRIWACEKDKERGVVLQRMINVAGAIEVVSVKAGQDFLKLDPSQKPWSSVGALLLDPSCSGSGIVGRDEALTFSLPSKETSLTNAKKSKKRKCQEGARPPARSSDAPENVAIDKSEGAQLVARLEALSAFQLRLLLKAFSFPAAHKVTYSTCSVHVEENEHVVLAALTSAIATERGWRILRREEQIPGMSAWAIRGKTVACKSFLGNNDTIAEACIRCDPYTEDGTQGFFVAAFVRDNIRGENLEDSWEGFKDAAV